METYESVKSNPDLLGVRQVVHGCRQLVSWDVGLSPAIILEYYSVLREETIK